MGRISKKNSEHLAMSIEQDFSKSKFSDFLISREQCKRTFEEAKRIESEMESKKTGAKRPVGGPRKKQ